jgi:hypothetical protein
VQFRVQFRSLSSLADSSLLHIQLNCPVIRHICSCGIGVAGMISSSNLDESVYMGNKITVDTTYTRKSKSEWNYSSVTVHIEHAKAASTANVPHPQRVVFGTCLPVSQSASQSVSQSVRQSISHSH